MAGFQLSTHFQNSLFCFQALKSVALQQHTSEQGYSPDSSTPGQKGLGSRLSVIMQVYQWGEGTWEITQTTQNKTILNPANWKVLEKNVAIQVTNHLGCCCALDLPNNSLMRFILHESHQGEVIRFTSCWFQYSVAHEPMCEENKREGEWGRENEGLNERAGVENRGRVRGREWKMGENN